MSQVCRTFAPSESVVTNFVTSTVTSEIITTGPASTSTTSSPVTSTICSTPRASGNETVSAVCRTSTSFVPVETVFPGSASTFTSFSTTVVEQLSTSFGEPSTTCEPVSASSSSSSTTTTTTETTTTTPTSFSFPSSSSSATDPSSSSSTTPAAVETTTSVRTTAPAAGPSTITSFLTVVITTMGSDGHVSTFTTSSGVASLNTAGASSNKKANTGAIAGGVVGGIVALVLALCLFWILRRKGFFRREDEQFNDDMWAPANHTPGVVGGGVGGNDEHDGGLDGNSGVMMSEKEGAGATEAGAGSVRLDPRQSWYGGSDGMSVVYSDGGRRGPSPGPQGGYGGGYECGAEGMVGPAAMGYMGAGVNRRTSHPSSSGHSHEGGPTSSYGHSLPPIPDHRLSQHDYYQQMAVPPNAYVGYGDQANRREELGYTDEGGRLQGADEGAVGGSVASDHSESARTAATTGSSVGLTSYPFLRPLVPLPPLDPQYSQQGAAGGAGFDPRRPNLEVLVEPQNSLGTATDSWEAATDSSGSTSKSPPSTAASSLTPILSSSSPSSSPTDAEMLASMMLARPKMERAASSASFVAPSQFLGARIVNVDEKDPEEKLVGLSDVRKHTP